MKTSTIVIIVSFVGFLFSFWNRNDLPGNIRYDANTLIEPVQSPTRTQPFNAVYEGVEYKVEPEYEYELYGMIVSYRHHDGDSRMHFQANDHLNMLDVCVIWGDNTRNPDLDKIDFWNGIFTCVVQTRDQQAWDAFDMYELSNNHLISADDYIRSQVRDIKVGDQIHVTGYLASYSSEGGGKRGTSTTRLDTGDGACETLFVEKFEIVEAATSYWRIAMYVFLFVLAIGLFVHFRRPYRPYQDDSS
jgi:hypothetical protein